MSTGLAVALHKWLTVLWFFAAFPIMLTGLRESIEVLMFISVYAIVASHWSAWQGARGEKRQEDDAR